MKRLSFFGCIVCLQLTTAFVASAQSKTNTNTLQAPPAGLNIDGSIKEWGDSLRYFNDEKKLNYALANDKDNIYMAIRLKDRLEQTRLLGAGLTLTINTKGSKSAMYTLTFPVADPNATPRTASGLLANKTGADAAPAEERAELMREKLTRLHNIKVTGFKDIEGDMITTTNTYGIKTAIDYDDNGYLIYEAAIPLKFFGDFKPEKNEWAFNFKINGIAKPEMKTPGEGGQGGGMSGGGGGGGRRGGGGGGGMGGGGMGGGGGGRRGGGGGMGAQRPAADTEADRSELFKSIDFWEKYYLAK